MATIALNYYCDLNQAVKVQYIDGNVFSGDNAGNTISVFVMDGDQPATIGGSVSADVIRADGSTVAVSGALDGNRAYVILPQACYAVPGSISIVIKNTQNTTITTIAALVGNVYRSSTDEIVDPGTIIPSISSLIAAIDAAIGSIPADYSALLASIAADYSSSKTYPVGAYCWEAGVLKRCIVPITSAETYTAAHWTNAVIGDDLSALKSAITSVEDEINELQYLADYGYHTAFFREPDPSQNSSLKLGIKRDEMVVVLNGTLNYSATQATRVRLNGNVTTTNSATTAEGWTTNTISLVAGHLYRAVLRLLSGIASTVPSIGITRSGESTVISTGTRPTSDTYIAEFTAEEGKTYNIAIFCIKNAVYTNAKVIVYLSDVTAEINANTETNRRLTSIETTIEYGMQKKWKPSDFTQGTWSSRSITVSSKAICTKTLYHVNAGDTLKIPNNPDGLYYAYAVYVGSSGSGQEASGWITGVHEHTFGVTGDMFLQCVNALASADRTDITPDDMTLDVGIMDNGYLVEGIGSIAQVIHTGDKKIAFLGDSITAGVGTNNIYHMYLGERFGWTCKNYGYGGSGYARSYPSTGGKMATGQTGMGVTITSSNKFEPNDFLARIATIDTTIDGLVIFGGTNDWAHGDVISVDAFKTAVNNVFTYAQTHFGRIPIIVLLPIHRGNDSTPNSTTGKTLREYCEIIKECSIPYGIRCIDLFSESGLNPANQHNNDLYYIRDDTEVSDSLHPNHYAHNVISNLIASALYDSLY